MNTADPYVTAEELQRYAELQNRALDCARHGDTELLALMLDAGMPLELRDTKGNTLLMLACYHQNTNTARMLLERGADPDGRNDRGQTPLGGAAFKGYSDVVELLLQFGADVNADQGGSKTPLLFATLFGRFATRRILKSSGGIHWRRQPE